MIIEMLIFEMVLQTGIPTPWLIEIAKGGTQAIMLAGALYMLAKLFLAEKKENENSRKTQDSNVKHLIIALESANRNSEVFAQIAREYLNDNKNRRIIEAETLELLKNLNAERNEKFKNKHR